MDVYRLRVRLGHVGRDNPDGIRVYGGREGVVITIDPAKSKTADVETRVNTEVADLLSIVHERIAEFQKQVTPEVGHDGT
jgi:hypothetical protein